MANIRENREDLIVAVEDLLKRVAALENKGNVLQKATKKK